MAKNSRDLVVCLSLFPSSRLLATMRLASGHRDLICDAPYNMMVPHILLHWLPHTTSLNIIIIIVGAPDKEGAVDCKKYPLPTGWPLLFARHFRLQLSADYSSLGTAGRAGGSPFSLNIVNIIGR